MALHLTELDRRKLARPPITSVICQIRFDPTPRIGEAKTIAAFHSALDGASGRYPIMAPVTETSINLAFGSSVVPPIGHQVGPSTGWRLADAKGAHVVTLMPQSIALEVTEYEGWETDFAPRLEELLQALKDNANPVFEQRLGLRYVNQLTEPEVSDPTGWREWVMPDLLGLAGNDEVGPHVRFLREQLILDVAEDVRSTLNHGFAPDPERGGKLTYLVDIDVARETMRPFDGAGILRAADEFNSYALKLFQLAVTPALRERLASS